MKRLIPLLLLAVITIACASKTPTVVIVNDKTQEEKKKEQEEYETRMKQARQWANEGAKEANETYRNLKVSDYAGKSFKSAKTQDMHTKTPGSTGKHEKPENGTDHSRVLPVQRPRNKTTERLIEKGFL